MFQKRIQSFKVAFRGLYDLWHTQFHSKIHLLVSILVVLSGMYFHISKTEWLISLICIGWVWSMEAMNTAIEKVVDLVSPEYHEFARMAKDVAAGAVLISAIISAIIGLLIFVPYLAASFGFISDTY